MSNSYESPDYVRISTAADMILGFSPCKFYRNAFPFCINSLLHFNDGCRANCLYCGQAREVMKGSLCKTLIRVDWPLRSLDSIIERLRKFMSNGCSFRPYRICVATITNPRAIDAEIDVVKRIHKELSIPISALITSTLFRKEDMKELKNSGVERIGIAIDCASKELFDILRGHRARGPHKWDRYMEGIIEAIEVMGEGKVGVHLIVGLGETEKEAVSLIQWIHDVGAETHLFSFYPEEGSVLERWFRPPIGQYRRVQLARYLIDNNISRAEDMKFNEYGQIIDFGIPEITLEEVIESGLPFVTSGCPGCNRPYANERPGETPRNYPYVPQQLEIEIIKYQLKLYTPPYNTKYELIKYLSNYITLAR